MELLAARAKLGGDAPRIGGWTFSSYSMAAVNNAYTALDAICGFLGKRPTELLNRNEIRVRYEQLKQVRRKFLELDDRDIGKMQVEIAKELNELFHPTAGSGQVAESPAISTPDGEQDHPDAKMTWQEAAERLKRLRDQGKPWTSQHEMARQFRCSSGTINKAIRETPDLRNWAKRQNAATPRAQSINDVVTDRTAQSRELDPEDEVAIREFIEKADPETKSWFLALSRENQLQVVNDPDKHQQILGRKP
jgi:hypothetical protein